MVNFTANRLASFKTKVWDQYLKLRQETDALQTQAQRLHQDLQDLNQDISKLVQEARDMGITVDLSGIDQPVNPNTTSDPFSVQFIGALVPAGIALTEFAASRLTAYVLANPELVTAATLTAARLLLGASLADKDDQQQIRSLDRQLAKNNLNAQQRAQFEAQRAQVQQHEARVASIMQRGKDKQKQAQEKAKQADKSKSQTKAKCKGVDCEKVVSQKEIDDILGGVKDIKDETVRNAILSRGGKTSTVRITGHWADRTVEEAAVGTAKNDALARTAIKLVKQAAKKAQDH